MKAYGQFCPVAKAAEVFCERWTPLILRDLVLGATRFSELQRGVPTMSPTLLSRRLKQLEAEGVIERRRAGRAHTYHLTRSGAEFAPLVEALGVWGQRWSRRELAKGEENLGLLLWTLERSVRPDAFGAARAVVQVEFTDQPKAKRLWWFVNEWDRVELCLDDPGQRIDLFLSCTLRDMIRIVRGDIALRRAIGSGTLDVHGSSAARAALDTWLNLGPLSKVRSERRASLSEAHAGAS